MDREQLEELISGHLDSELNSEEVEQLESLLQSSQEARDLLASYRSQGDRLRTLPDLEAPERLRQKVQSKVTKAPSPQPRKLSNLRWFVATIAASFSCFFASHMLTPPAEYYHLSSSGLFEEPISSESTYDYSRTSGQVLSLETPLLRGTVSEGDAQLAFEADAGLLRGKRIKVRLSIDTDGDDVFDTSTESDFFELNDRVGFQTIRTSFSLQSLEGKEIKGRAKVDLMCEDADVDGVRLRFVAGGSHLKLPLELESS